MPAGTYAGPVTASNVCLIMTITGISSKANVDTFEENMFHIIRAFQVAGVARIAANAAARLSAGYSAALLNRRIIKAISMNFMEKHQGRKDDTLASCGIHRRRREPDVMAKEEKSDAIACKSRIGELFSAMNGNRELYVPVTKAGKVNFDKVERRCECESEARCIL